MIKSAHTTRNRFLSTTAITALSMLALSPATMAQDAKFVGDYDVWEFDGIAATEKRQGYVRYEGDRIVGNLTQEDIGRLGHVDLKANLTVATGVEAGPMHILGKLTSTGQVMVLDTEGFLFGSNSVVDTAGLAVLGGAATNLGSFGIDSALDVKISENAKIDIQEGASITMADAGLAAFVAPTVSNAGIIQAKMGKVIIGSAERATVDFYGDNLFEVALSGEAEKAVINNTGTISAEGGEILITANAAKDAVENVINMDGVVSASSFTTKGGKIVLGGKGTTVKVAGKIEANGTDGGEIEIVAEEIETKSTAEVYADSTAGGNGGHIFLWGDRRTFAAGRFSAAGKDGFVETSGNEIDLDSDVVVTAATWMIDPIDIIITAGIASALETNLNNIANANSTIIVDTSAAPYGGAGADAGNIDIDNDITWAGGAALQFNADNNINLNANITSNFASGTGSQGAVTFNAANEVNIGQSVATAKITTVNGDITMNNAGIFTATANSLETSNGEISINQNDGGSIQNAVDAINNTGTGFNTIHVGAGNYSGNIDVNETNTRLWGEQKFKDARSRAATNESIITGNSPAVILSADGTTINGFEIVGGNPGVLVTGNDTRIRNNIIHNQIGGAGSFDGIALNNVNKADIFQNKIFNVSESGIQNNGSTDVVIRNNKIDDVRIAIKELGAENSMINDNEITNTVEAVVIRNATGTTEVLRNSITETGFNGILFDGFETAIVEGNTISRTGDDGLDILNGDTIEISTNTIEEVGFVSNGAKADFATKADGIFISGLTGTATIADNMITKTYDDGIQLGNVNVNLSGNNVLDQIGNDGGTNLNGADSNGADGIFAFRTTGTISEATITNSQQDGIDIRRGTSDLTVSQNIITDANRIGVVVTKGSNGVSVENNIITDASVAGVQNFNSRNTRITGNEISGSFLGINVIGNSENITIGALDTVLTDPTNRNTIDDVNIGVNVDGAIDIDITNNKITNSREAIVIRRQQGNLDVNDNVIDATQFNAILVDGFDRALLDGNNITNTGDDGIDLRNGNFAEVTNNTMNRLGFFGAGDNADPATGADGIHINNVGSLANDMVLLSQANSEIAIEGPQTEYGSIIYNNTISKTYDDGIEVIDGGPTLITENTLSEIGNDNGAYLGGADEYGADGVHVRNARGTFNYLDPLYQELGTAHVVIVDDVVETTSATIVDSDIVYTPSTSLEEYSVIIADNDISRTSDDGIEVLGEDEMVISTRAESVDEFPIPSIYGGTGRTLIAYNTLSNIGVGVIEDGPSTYGPDLDGYGADAIHVRGVVGNIEEGPIVRPFPVDEQESTAFVENEILSPSEFIDGFGYQVEILENNIETVADDGIEVLQSGKTLIAHNTISDAGLLNSMPLVAARSYRRNYDGNDSDGIHVENIWAISHSPVPTAERLENENFILSEQNSVEIVDNYISSTGDDGIEVLQSGNTLIDRNIVSFAGSESEGDEYGADGIAVANGYTGFIGGRLIDNEIDENGFVGRLLPISEDPVIIPTRTNISRNTVSNSADDGIESVGSSTMIIDDNTVEFSGDDGITALGYAAFGEPIFRGYPVNLAESESLKAPVFDWPEFSLTATNNIVSQSGTDGLQAEGFDSALIAINEISDSTENGIFVSGFNNGDVDVEDNTLTANDIGAQFESGVIDLTGETNTFNGGRVGLRFAPFEFAGDVLPPIDDDLDAIFTLSPSSSSLPQPGEDNNEYTELYPYPFMAETGDFANLELVDNDGPGSDPFGTFLPTNFGGTIGEQFFDGQSDFFVELANGAFFDPGTPTLLNGTDSTYITPFGPVTPSSLGGLLTQDEFDFIDARIFDFIDDGSLGLFFFGVVNPIDENDVNRNTDPANFQAPQTQVSVLSLPNIPGGPQSLNNIATFAGGNSDENGNGGEQKGFTPEQLNKIETAAGSNAEAVTCWGDAANIASAGQITNVTFGGGLDDALGQESGCSSSSL